MLKRRFYCSKQGIRQPPQQAKTSKTTIAGTANRPATNVATFQMEYQAKKQMTKQMTTANAMAPVLRMYGAALALSSLKLLGLLQSVQRCRLC